MILRTIFELTLISYWHWEGFFFLHIVINEKMQYQSCKHLLLAIRDISYNEQQDTKNSIHLASNKFSQSGRLSNLFIGRTCKDWWIFSELSAESGRVVSSAMSAHSFVSLETQILSTAMSIVINSNTHKRLVGKTNQGM